jgi:hypothetical protein
MIKTIIINITVFNSLCSIVVRSLIITVVSPPSFRFHCF